LALFPGSFRALFPERRSRLLRQVHQRPLSFGSLRSLLDISASSRTLLWCRHIVFSLYLGSAPKATPVVNHAIGSDGHFRELLCQPTVDRHRRGVVRMRFAVTYFQKPRVGQLQWAKITNPAARSGT
jgi:hypothetical protein